MAALFRDVLSAPKPTSFQHYLVQPVVQSSNGRAKPGADHMKTLHNWDQPEPGVYDFIDTSGRRRATGTGSTIRGHKKYWHKRNTSFRDIADNNARLSESGREVQSQARNGQWRISSSHTIIRPVKPGVVFRTHVRFESLSDIELGAVLSALKLPPSMRHRLGMGKPLGMGSVKIESVLRITSRTAGRYDTLFSSDGTLAMGELSTEHNEDIERRARTAFSRAIISHYYGSRCSVRPVHGNLWCIPRLATLALLLEWNNAPGARDTRYVPMGHEWGKRRVLPTPHGVISVREPDPCDVVSAQVGNEHESTPVRQVAKSSFRAREADEIKSVIRSLRGKGEVSRPCAGDCRANNKIDLLTR